MGLTIYNPIGATLSSTTTAATITKTTTSSTTHFSLLHSNHHPKPPTSRKQSHIVAAKGKFTSRTSKFDSKNRRGASSTTTKDNIQEDRVDQLKSRIYEDSFDKGDVGVIDDVFVDDGFVVPELPGDKPDLWEGPQWDGVGFFVQYMWAFGVVFAVSISLFIYLSV
ncbi:hypothetical protein RND81_06G064600 [Saponaria officinalis]|uniref:Uncharacterized protein n=1 Tax=Saponaria officinalis TaxID=3572 RepID=A0AAW1K4A7_SAPOF